MTNENTSKSILIVEDDDSIRETLQEILEVEGYRVETAIDGQEALDRLRRLPLPSLILLDLMLPNVNGWQVIEKLRLDIDAPQAGVPIVITSAAGDMAAMTAKKVDGYLKKPIQLDSLLKVAEKYCGPQVLI